MIQAATTADRKETTVGMQLNDKLINMVVDTGADVSILFQKEWQEIGKPPLFKAHCTLRSFSGSEIPVLGRTNVQIGYGEQRTHLSVIVVRHGKPLIEKSWLQKIRLDRTTIFKVTAQASDTLDGLFQKYQEVFEAGGTENPKEIKVHLK